MSTTHPQVGTYLDDLARMLTDIDPGERDDILASVREHLDAEISAGDGTDAVVHAALRRLGPPEQVAAEARLRDPGHDAPPTVQVPQSGPVSARGAGLVRVACLATALSTLPAILVSLWIKVTSLFPREVVLGQAEELSLFTLNGIEVMFLALLCLPLWLVAVGCALLTDALSGPTRTRLVGVGPIAVGMTLLTMPPKGPDIVTAAAIALLVVTGVGVLHVCRRAWREAQGS